MPRAWVWLQVLAGWLPVWALYAALIVFVHRPQSPAHAALAALQAIAPAALLGLLVHRWTKRVAWPRPFRLSFVVVHLLAAAVYAVAWLLAASLVESLLRGRIAVVAGPGILPFLVLGVWLYAMAAGVSYAVEATERAARAEAVAARSQLAALRAQLHPHFLFNALHTVVQLIPREPARAAEAAEQVAALLRATIEEDRDLVPLADEWAFVTRYLEVERLRFGERLRVRLELDEAARPLLVPSFALQTLVENAVRHGAAPRVEPTEVSVAASATPAALVLRVRDTGNGGPGGPGEPEGRGTGLGRLRERLAALYDGEARLELATGAGGFTASIVIPRARVAEEEA